PGLFCSIRLTIFFAVKKQDQVPLAGETSLATTVVLRGVIVGTILCGLLFIGERRNRTDAFSESVYWRDCPVVVLSSALILGIALMGVFWLFDAIFNGATFDRLTATIIFFVFETMINYVMLFAAFSLSSRTLIRLFTAVIVGG